MAWKEEASEILFGHGVSINDQAKTLILNVCKLKLKTTSDEKRVPETTEALLYNFGTRNRCYSPFTNQREGLSLLMILTKVQFEGKYTVCRSMSYQGLTDCMYDLPYCIQFTYDSMHSMYCFLVLYTCIYCVL